MAYPVNPTEFARFFMQMAHNNAAATATPADYGNFFKTPMASPFWSSTSPRSKTTGSKKTAGSKKTTGGKKTAGHKKTQAPVSSEEVSDSDDDLEFVGADYINPTGVNAGNSTTTTNNTSNNATSNNNTDDDSNDSDDDVVFVKETTEVLRGPRQSEYSIYDQIKREYEAAHAAFQNPTTGKAQSAYNIKMMRGTPYDKPPTIQKPRKETKPHAHPYASRFPNFDFNQLDAQKALIRANSSEASDVRRNTFLDDIIAEGKKTLFLYKKYEGKYFRVLFAYRKTSTCASFRKQNDIDIIAEWANVEEITFRMIKKGFNTCNNEYIGTETAEELAVILDQYLNPLQKIHQSYASKV